MPSTLQPRRRADPHSRHPRRDAGLQLQPRQVDDLDQLGIHRHALARLGQALRDQPADRRAQRGVGERLARQLHAGQRGLQRGLRAGFGGHGVVQHRGRDEALRDQRLVVVQGALRDVELRARASACCSAWRSRQSYSVVSSCVSTWPARTLSPSRTATDFTSAATRALTKALFTATRLPETSSVRVSSAMRTRHQVACTSASASPPWALRRARPVGPCAPISTRAAARSQHGHRGQRQRPLEPALHAAARLSPGPWLRAWGAGLQAMQHQVDLGVQAAWSGSCPGAIAGHAPMECLCSAMKSIGAISVCVASFSGTARNSPRCMPRCSVPAISRCAGMMTSSTVELRQFGEVAHFGNDDLEDAAGLTVAHALPPGCASAGAATARSARRSGRQSAGPRQ